MTLQDVLNADMSTLWGLLRQGVVWWTAELKAMLPPSWRGRLGGGYQVVEQLPEGRWAVRRDGVQPIPLSADALSRLRRVDLALPWSEVLTRDLSLPLLNAGDLQRLLALDLERLTSFRPEDALWTFKVIDRRPDLRRQTVRLALIRRVRGQTLVNDAAAAGLDIRTIGAGGDARALEFVFDQDRGGLFGGAAGSRLTALRIAVAGLIAANLFSLFLKDVVATQQMRAAVDTRHAETLAVERLRRRARAEAASRQAWTQSLNRQDPLRVLNAVTLALPAKAWVRHFEWNSRVARIAGFAESGVDPTRALSRSPIFVQVRALPVAEAPETGKATFDIAAQVRPPGAPR